MPEAVRYRVRCLDHGAHLYEVTCRIAQPDPDGQRLTLPAWIPGSYLVRDFARHVVALQAHCGEAAVAVVKTDKSSWRCAPCDGPLTLRAEVYAHDLSVRGAWLDDQRAFFNGTSLFLRPEGQTDAPCELELPAPEGRDQWRAVTAMPAVDVDERGFGLYRAADYEELVDHPVEIGVQTVFDFEAAGVPHRFAIAGVHRADTGRLARDLATLCAWHIDFFGRPAPMSRYVFMGLATGDGYGGLEHRDSTALMFRRADLPAPGSTRVDRGYRRLLGLCSHEYFHSWNVKRIRPAAFSPPDLSSENYTRLLWVFEGITSYYDDLALLRSGLITPASYLELLGQTITRVQRGAGRLRQSVADSSFDAWIKFYRPDENTANAVVSYYAKGALVALALDLTLRRRTGGHVTLDEVMRELWRRYGLTGEGVPEDGFERLVAELSGLADLDGFFDAAVRGTSELPLAERLAEVGVALKWRTATGGADVGGAPPAADARPRPWLGVTLQTVDGRSTLATVIAGGPAQRAGLSAGDELLALDGLKLLPSNFDALLSSRRAGERVEVTAFRRDELLRRTLTLGEPPRDTAWLEPVADADASTRAARAAWLGRDTDAS